MSKAEIMDMSEFRKNLTSKVKEEFINLIPEERLNLMTNQIIQDFKKNDLERFVKELLEERLKADIKEYFASLSVEEWNQKTNRMEINKELKKLIVEIAPEMFANILGNTVNMMLQSAQSRGY